MNKPYDTASILRQNVADLERELQRQRERADNAIAEARADLQGWIESRNEWMARAEKAEAELKAAQDQSPSVWIATKNNTGYQAVIRSKKHIERYASAGWLIEQFYTSPIPAPAPAVSDSNPVQWLEDEGDNILVPRGLLGAACSAIDKQRHAPKVVEAMRHYTQSAAPAVPAPEIPDGDAFNGTTLHLIQCIESLVRMNDCGVLVPHGIGGHARTLLLASANRLRQQPVLAVHAEWREVMAELAADLQAYIDAEHAYRDQYSFVMRKYQNDMRIVERARALLQYAGENP